MKKITLIGGGGYVGTAITEYFLNKKFKVNCVDNFIYKHKNVVDEFLKNKNFNLVNGCMSSLKKDDKIFDTDAIVILAGVVGDPITKKYQEFSVETNEDKTLKFLNDLKFFYKNKVIFISTCSNYGLKSNDVISDEKSILEPLSFYANSKVKVEKFILEHDKPFQDITILRFATAFGCSKRMRFDLTVNEFTKEIFYKNSLLVYDKDTWRPYCHVVDFARLIEKVIEANKKITNQEVFNAGSNQNHATKKTIIDKISLKLEPKGIEYLDKSIDKRNYKVNFEKVKKST